MFDDEGNLSSTHLIRRAWQFFPAWVNLLIMAFLLIGGLTIAGQRLGFWLDTQNARHQGQIIKQQNQNDQESNNVQQGYLAAINNDIGAIDSNIAVGGSTSDPGSMAQNIHSGNDACLNAEKLIPSAIQIPSDLSTWVRVNCVDGALAPTSNVYKGGNGE